jgi:hypothetical protein
MFIYSIVFFCPSICNKCVIYSIYTHSNIYTFSILSGAHPSHRKHLAIERTNHTTTWQASWALNEMNMHIFIYVQLCTFISQSMFLDLLIFVSYIFPVENPLLGESAGNVFHFWWFSKQTQVFWPSQDTKDIIIQSSHGWLSATTLFLRVFSQMRRRMWVASSNPGWKIPRRWTWQRSEMAILVKLGRSSATLMDFRKRGGPFSGAKKGSSLSSHQHIPTTWAWLNVATFIDIWMSVDL